MNLKRIRVDPDGLITQDQKGFLKRIRLTKVDVRRVMEDPEEALRRLSKQMKDLDAFFSLDGTLDARLDIIDEETDFLNRPLRIYYGIEPRCNLSCPMCGPRDFHEGFKPAPIETEDFLFQQFADANAFQIQLTGGEIGIRGYDLLQTISKTADLGFAVILSTNGVWRCIDNKDKFLEGLVECGNIIQSKISIEGTPEFHDSIRGKGTYEETVNTLAKLSEYGLNPRINTTIFKSSCNREQLEHLVGLALKYKAGLQPIPLRPIGEGSKIKDQTPTKKELLEYTLYATKLRQKTGAYITFNFDIFDPRTQVPIYDFRRAVSCGAPLMGPHVTHTGECYPCGFVQEVPEFMAGRITHERSLIDIWLNSEVLDRVRYAGKSEECNSCNDYGKGCWGGCWVMGWIATGKINGMDPYCLKQPIPSKSAFS